MFQIRQSVFETNSSSSHSIVVKKKGGYDTSSMQEECNQGIIRLWEAEMDFGRGFELLHNWEGRLRYAIAYYADRPSIVEGLLEALRKRVPGFRDVSFHFSRGNDYDENGIRRYPGWVDHQSYGVLDIALREEEISLDEFVLNDKYMVVVDGDEYDQWGALKAARVVNLDEIEEEYN